MSHQDPAASSEQTAGALSANTDPHLVALKITAEGLTSGLVASRAAEALSVLILWMSMILS